MESPDFPNDISLAMTQAFEKTGKLMAYAEPEVGDYIARMRDEKMDPGKLTVLARSIINVLCKPSEDKNINAGTMVKLTPGANNGLGIHAPLYGDAAYLGKEIQILDNTAEKYKQLRPYQYHGSVYGVLPAKRGYLNKVGKWNEEEVYVSGDEIRITLNGEIIVEGNLKEALDNGTIDGRWHPGLRRRTGHIGFLGHGDVVYFRNIRIKEL